MALSSLFPVSSRGSKESVDAIFLAALHILRIMTGDPHNAINISTMIASNFRSEYNDYTGMTIWSTGSFEEFMTSHEKLHEIFEKEYGFLFNTKLTGEFPDSDIDAIKKLLGWFDDTYFIVFTMDDSCHEDLIYLQESGKINFGMNIRDLDSGKIYVLEMNKSELPAPHNVN